MLRPLKKHRQADESGSATPAGGKMNDLRSGGPKPGRPVSPKFAVGGQKSGSVKPGSLRPAETPATAYDPSAPGQPTVGRLLAQTRQKFGQDLPQVAQALRIKPAYIQAIEQDRYGDLPGLAYGVGFVRSYGDYLGLDGKALVQRYKDEAQGINRAPDLHFPSLAPEAKVPTGAIILVSLLLLGVAYAGWTYFSRETGTPPSVTAVLTQPSQPAPAPADATAAVASEQPTVAAPAVEAPAAEPAAALPAPVEQAPAPAAPTLATGTASTGTTSTGPAVTTAPIATPPLAAAPPAAPAAPQGSLGAPLAAPLAEAPDGSGTATIVSGAEETAAGIPSAPPAPAGTATQQAAAPADGGSRVVLRATQDSWIRISDAKDQPVMTQVLRAGESYAVPDQKGLVLLTGNAGGLTIELDGKALPPLGAAGAVKRNIALDPDKLAGAVN